MVAMTSAARDRAPKPSRARFWFDPRFAIGVVVVAVSVAGVVAIVGAADASTPVLAARAPLAPGDHVDRDDLVATSVRLGGAERLYLSADDVPPDGLVVTRAVAAGELVAASAVGSMLGERETAVVLAVDGELAGSVVPGSGVDVWSARQSTSGVFEAPAVIVSAATVVRLVDREGFVVDDGSAAVEVLVPRAQVARVLEAVANDDSISVVPSSLPVSVEGSGAGPGAGTGPDSGADSGADEGSGR